jgi:putative transposase
MSLLYEHVGITRQAHHQWHHRTEHQQLEAQALIAQMREHRQSHPAMGLRKLYLLVSERPSMLSIGRDRFIAIAVNAGLQLPPTVNHQRTTRAVSSMYPNLLIGRTLNDVNQAWVSDITYYRLNDGFCYLTLIMDLYSRRIVAATAATTLEAHWSASAVKTALIERGITAADGLIHHSDKGGQYLSKEYLSILAAHDVSISTCQIVYENAHAERVNGTIKQEYLNAWVIDSYAMLVGLLAVAVDRYNQSRPHERLQMMSPDAFERMLRTLPIDEHPPMPIWPEQPLVNLTENVTVPYIVH